MSQFEFLSIDRTEFQILVLRVEMFQMKDFYFCLIFSTNYSWKVTITVTYTTLQRC